MRRRGRAIRWAAIAVGLATVGSITSVAVRAQAGPTSRASKYAAHCVARPVPIPSDAALTDASVTGHGRLRTYTMTSPAVGLTHVNVLLPVGYNRRASRRYPTLYLLHGALGSYADWASTITAAGQPQGGNVQTLVGALPVIVVMPDDSPNGSYTDWYGLSTKDASAVPPPPTPAWETYHIDELIPWVDATFPTQPTAAGRAIAGLSSGGGGAAKYAAAHPGLFGFVGTFSGALDNDLVDSTINWYATSNARNPTSTPDDRCTFGDPFTTDAKNAAYYWYDNDPTYEAANLDGVKLFVASGNGTPTAADAHANPSVVGAQGAIERVVDDMSHRFVAAVRNAGLDANLTTDFYGDGIHGWYYWQRDLGSFLRWLGPQLDKPLLRPATFSYRTARVVSSAWGWSFHHDSGLAVPNVNTAEEFVYLSHVSPSGLIAQGDGTLRITTPKGSYGVGSSDDVTVGRVTTRIRANPAGELRIKVVFGRAAKHSQVVFPAVGAPANTPRVEVSISPAPLPASHSAPLWVIAFGAIGAAMLSVVVIWRLRRHLHADSTQP
jgi:S-formylglutathione hydrolase FrmB